MFPTFVSVLSDRKCGKNEEFMSCGTECEPTCNVMSSKCTDKCLESVCQCKSGFKRGEKDQNTAKTCRGLR
ncbi:unnamed protein product [Haemonchus placei]|uniref:TIL domain-containing protein n=1 Tax=Haemonchus placei TaxID=6290 RepID=A0A158QP98_HAEPC|nr:unnamed protein product [Haemonchus placei]